MDETLDQFSVYSMLSKPRSSDNPLRDLLPDSYDYGWHVARNLLKPLNHLDFLRHKEKLAVDLNLHNNITSPQVFDVNYAVLARHQA
ncbi:MAG: hypothetical protein RMK79_10705, partial [Anaerolineae bacterium]|nr:hypothetical protein [Anaerolineae bacterium]